MDEFGWISSIGIVIYGSLLLYTLMRIISSLSILRSQRTIKYFNYKMSFHLVFAVYCTSETIYYSSLLIEDGLSAWGYSFHMVSLFLNVVFFAMVVNLWGYTLNYSDYYSKFSILGGLLNLVNGVATAIDLIYLGTSDGYGDYATMDLLSVTTTSIHVLSLLIFTIVLLIFGLQIKNKLSQSHRGTRNTLSHRSGYGLDDDSDRQTKLNLITRINSVLNICCLCYLVRVVLLCWLINDTIQYAADDEGLTSKIPFLLWFGLTGWVPTVGPSVIFLYIMKTTRVSRPTTSPSTRPPAEGTTLSHSQYEDSSRYSWYYEENEVDDIRNLSIAHPFESSDGTGTGLNPIALKILQSDSIDRI